MLSILTSIIGIAAKGRAAKAIAGGMSGALLMAAEPAVTSFQEGFGAGMGDSVYQLGLTLGTVVGGYIVGHVITWLSPANKS